ncbi:BolA family protein [Hyalangium rubrum]|uniref:BolA/IbaG family iron-sulfur metabolism protein n=1 Tax=Hyalangium rubrum TaxID=3103134 RepID=A0ABU5H5V6_9BACT|nr:BolA/IbaG family iron-sulfur metabolism protein [Hyalangium sp. s54d21]MDY7228859.1 BolA/IbaG family iron-sulfur metabolism protein [Hyalangium sp. s54d21]
MLDAERIAARILGALPGAEVQIQDSTGTGDHFEARVVSADFAGKTLVQQHKLVYASVQDWLDTGELHALALKTYSPEQWKKLGPR